MKYMMIVIFALLGIRTMQAQEYAFDSQMHNLSLVSLPDIQSSMLPPLPVMQDDSFPQMVKPRLLPENISFMEKGLWGEDGILRTTGIAAPLTPESRRSELSLRRTMLVAHQIGGFVTLGLMITAVYYGQKMLDENLSNKSDRNSHQLFVAATITSYSITGLLAVLSPPPMIRRDESSTTTLHKALAWVHFTGMVLTPILGSMISRHATNAQIEHFHQASAYITTTALAASLIVITF
ncbi:MAG: hypothetical protein WAV76_00100 [Bacteroidota bacterium]